MPGKLAAPVAVEKGGACVRVEERCRIDVIHACQDQRYVVGEQVLYALQRAQPPIEIIGQTDGRGLPPVGQQVPWITTNLHGNRAPGVLTGGDHLTISRIGLSQQPLVGLPNLLIKRGQFGIRGDGEPTLLLILRAMLFCLGYGLGTRVIPLRTRGDWRETDKGGGDDNALHVFTLRGFLPMREKNGLGEMPCPLFLTGDGGVGLPVVSVAWGAEPCRR